MNKPYYELYNERQTLMKNYSIARNALINLGIISIALSLIIFGVNLINDNQNSRLSMAFAVCLSAAMASFFLTIIINQKLRDLRTQRKYRAKNILVHN